MYFVVNTTPLGWLRVGILFWGSRDKIMVVRKKGEFVELRGGSGGNETRVWGTVCQSGGLGSICSDLDDDVQLNCRLPFAQIVAESRRRDVECVFLVISHAWTTDCRAQTVVIPFPWSLFV